MRRLLMLAALALLVGGTANASDLPHGKWWYRPEMIQRLGLTEDQQMRLESIFRNSANDLIDLRGSVEKMSIAVHGELDQPQINRETLRRAATRLSEAQGRLFERELMMLVDMRAVLSDEQWARFRAELDRPHPPMQRQKPPKE
jgi:uncharacterized protein (DUF1778 family)